MKKVLLYGAGKIGNVYYNQLLKCDKADLIYAYCDKNNEVKEKNGLPVISYEAAKKLKLPFIISVSDAYPIFEEIKSRLENDGMEYYLNLRDFMKRELNYDMVKFDRDNCASYHDVAMEDYFTNAEEKGHLDVFWGENSVFKKFFEYLDLENVVELACGRGRHVANYIDKAGDITLVDILDKNIEYVQKRFASLSNIHFYKNNGYDLTELPSNKYTSLFTYDSMVHFELFDIYSYLKETYRILVPGGYALFHHSNNSSDYKNSFEYNRNLGGRNFMDKQIFAYLAYKAGFEIVEQHVLDWDMPEQDCITLVRKL